MPRGQESPIGTERTSPNGYLYRKTEDGWQTVHTLVMEERLGRPLREDEFVKFSDGDKGNVDPDNLILGLKGRKSLLRRAAVVEARIAELQVTLDELNRRLQIQEKL
jgi:hypothetical protein